MTRRLFLWSWAAVFAAALLASPASAIEIAEQRGDFYYDSEGTLVGLRNADFPEEARRPMSHREKFEIMGIKLPEQRPMLQQRVVAQKPAEVLVHDGLMLDHLIVKFNDFQPVRLRADRLTVQGSTLPEWKAILDRHPEVVVSRAFSLEERIYDENKETGELLSGRELADLNNYYLVLFPTADEGNADLANRILQLDDVETAYFQGIDFDPVCADISPTTPLWEANQNYLDPAPTGLDAEFAWAYHAGGNGYGPGYWVMDLERTWCDGHEDLDFDWASDIVNGETGGWYSDHGTSVLGIIGACDNAYGMTGISSDVSLKAADHNSEATYGDCITVADGYLLAGEVMVLETHIPGPSTGTACPCNCGQFEYVPLEWDQGAYDAIEIATANGVIVVEAGGNGSVDLDLAVYGNKFQTWFRDSGAILVGAAEVDHDPICFTNHGNRMDVHGFGELAPSTGYGDLWSQAGCTQDYTSVFSGTSSATPMIAGACASVQGISKAKYGITLTPAQMRTILKIGGTPQGTPAANLIGPMPDLANVINALEPDVTPGTPTGWSYAVVPRSTNDSAWGSVPLQAGALPGNVAGTYFNWAWHNISTYTPTLNAPHTLVRRNDSGIWQANANLAAGAWAWAGNNGPDVVKGGRHSIVSLADYYGVEEESNELNNSYVRQYIWSPYALTMGSPVQRTDDPPAISEYWTGYYNAEGFSGTTGSPYWYAFAVMPTSASNDFDVRMNTETPSNIPQAGFGANVAWSSDGAGEIDFTILDRNEVASGTYYASIVNFDGAGAADKVVQFEGDLGTLPGLGTFGPYTMAAGDLINLHEISLAAGAGEYRVHVQVTSGSADYGLSIYDTVGGFFSKTQTLAGGYADNAGAAGDEYVVITPTTSSFHGIAVWKADADDRNASLTYNLIITQSPNLTAATPSGWYGPVVPRNTTDATTTYAPLPATLTGNTTTTSYNFSTFNEGANAATTPWSTYLFLDDFWSWIGPGSSIGSGTFRYWTNTSQGLDPYSLVRGGRHHVRIQADALAELPELFEGDNDFTDWFVWTPLELANQTPVTRDAPPVRNPQGYGPYYSTDGFRSIRAGEYWTAVGVMPVSLTDDYDVELFPASTGSKDGFGSNLAWSTAVSGAVDFAMVNFNVVGTAPYDFGALNWNAGAGDFVIERSNSVTHGVYSGGPYWIGPNTIGANRILDVWEFYVDAPAVGTPVYISLDNVSGNANLGFALFDYSGSYYSRFSYLRDANAGGNGQDEHMTPITFAATGWYSIVVYKSGSLDLPKSGEYRVALSTDDMVGAPSIEAAPTRLALAPPRPNPFRGETHIRYDVPAESGPVLVSVHDLAGRRIATLVDGIRPAGRHTAIWNGRDESGDRVASGVYFVRMQAGDFQQSRKVMIVK